MGLFDFLGDVLKGAGEVALNMANDPQQQYNVGKLAALHGQDRHMWNLGPNNGSADWQRLRRLEKAYNSGYDAGRAERKAALKRSKR